MTGINGIATVSIDLLIVYCSLTAYKNSNANTLLTNLFLSVNHK